MIALIQKSKISGKIKAPSSKSYTHRALVLAALAKGKSKIISPLTSDDTEATIDCLRKIGIRIKKKKKIWEVQGGKFLIPKKDLFCRESGTTLRFMTAVSALIKGKCRLTGEKSLLKRPIKPLVKALRQLGVDVSSQGEFPPVVVENNFIGGKVKLPGDISSQFISALLLITPFAQKEVEIELTTPLESKPYVLMTIGAQKKFGVKVNCSQDLRRFKIKKQKYKNTNYLVEGDWSSAAPFLAAGAIGGRVEVENLNPRSLQADKEIIKILERMGVRIIIKKNSVIAEKSELKSIKANVKNCPDLFPIICVLAAMAKGKSEISGIKKLRIKESDRIEEMGKGLSKMGIKTYLKENRFYVKGSTPKGGIINSTDHRIAMAFSVLGLATGGKTVIEKAECVSKSFPQFWKELIKAKANVKLIK